jgi:receptor protein-tyrosine kinase
VKLTDYVRRILHRWRVITSVVVVVVSGVMAVTFMTTPVYQSTGQVFVSVSAEITDMSDQIAAAQYAQQKVYSYAAVASSQKMAAAVIQDLGLNETPATIARKITTNVAYSTVIVAISVQDENARMAKRIADSVIANYNDVLSSLDSRADTAPITVSTLQYPSLPVKVKPLPGLNLVAGLAAGLLLGLAGAALRDILDDSAKGTEALAEAGLSVLGAIPQRTDPRGKTEVESDTAPLVSSADRSAVAEAFRQLRLSIQFARLSANPRTLLVTSAEAGEGKSYVSANLGAVYADAGLRVLLVDLDLRRPTLAARLGAVNQVGLMNVLVGSLSLEEAIQTTTTDGLFLLSTGPLPPNPADVLASPVVGDLLNRAAGEFDVVVIDSPPAGLFVDARELGSLVDGIIMVARRKTTSVRAISETVKQLSAVGADLLGVVMNFAEVQGDHAEAYGSYTDRRPRSDRPQAGARRRTEAS